MPNNIVELSLPIEWAAYFDGFRDNPEDVEFAPNELEEFLEDNPHLSFHSVDTGRSYRTTDHDTPGYELDDLSCYTFVFISTGATHKKRIVKIGEATKIPFPKEPA
jgi:hypothetical protein